jgi:uncharacterized protein YqgC (DUF456 family)
MLAVSLPCFQRITKRPALLLDYFFSPASCTFQNKAVSLQTNFNNEFIMEIFLLCIAFLCMLVGIIGCIVPGLPGTPVAYLGLLIAQATERVDFSWQTLLVWAVVTVIVSVLDYVVPAWGTKKFGGTKYGVWGSTLGVFVGLFFGAIGVIVGPLVGAVLGELIGGKEVAAALKAGWGSFVGLLCGTILKLICCGLMTVRLIQAVW